MKRIAIIIFSVLFIAIILFGCKDQEVNNNLKFTDTIHISGQDADIDAMGALNLKVIDSILIVSTKKKVGFWSFYDLKSKRHLGDFLNKGNSNSEFLGSPLAGRQHFERDENGDLISLVYDFSKGGLKKFNITKSLNSQHPEVELTDIQLPRNIFSWTMLHSGEFLISEPDMSHAFENRSIFSNNKKKVLPTSYLFDNLKISSKGDINDVGTIISSHPSRDMVVECGKKLNKIYLYSIDGSFVKEISIDEEVPVSIEALERVGKRNKKDCFRDLECTENYFCVLFSGNNQRQETTKGNNSKIYIFSWMGEPITCIYLDRVVTSFSFDWKNKKLYTLNYNTEEIVEYDVSSVNISI